MELEVAQIKENWCVDQRWRCSGLANVYGAPWYTKLEASEVDESWHSSY